MKYTKYIVASLLTLSFFQNAKADFLCKGFSDQSGQMLVHIDLSFPVSSLFQEEGEGSVYLASEKNPLEKIEALTKKSLLRSGSLYKAEFANSDSNIFIYESVKWVPTFPGGCHPHSKIDCDFVEEKSYDASLHLEGEKIELYCQVIN